MCKEQNIYLIDNTNKIKEEHLNKVKLPLNERGTNVLSSTFVSELSRIVIKIIQALLLKNVTLIKKI